MWNIGHLVLVAAIFLVVGGILGAMIMRQVLRKQLQKIEEDYQKSVRKTYQEMGNFFGRKMREEDLNRITTQLEGEITSQTKKSNSKKPKPKKKK